MQQMCGLSWTHRVPMWWAQTSGAVGHSCLKGGYRLPCVSVSPSGTWVQEQYAAHNKLVAVTFTVMVPFSTFLRVQGCRRQSATGSLASPQAPAADLRS